MVHYIRTAAALIALTLLAIPFAIPAAFAADQVDLLLVLSSDVSRSVDHPKFLLQREGYRVTLAKDGRVLDANPIAEQILRDGDALTQVAGRLTAASRNANDSLQRVIANTAQFSLDRKNFNPDLDPLVVPRRTGSPIRLLIAPLAVSPLTLRSVDPVIVVFLFAKNAGPTICPSTLSLVYGITPAEARIAAKLAEGCSFKEIARALSISIETVRTHIKRVFAKMDCDSQATLVREILLGPTLSFSSREL